MKYVVTLNGKNYEVDVEEADAVITSVTPAAAPAAPVSAPASPAASPAPASPVPSGSGTKVVSPMPGTILSVSVSVGQQVKAGQVMMILEAMKMENEIVAPCDGTVTSVIVSKGYAVDTDGVLAIIG